MNSQKPSQQHQRCMSKETNQRGIRYSEYDISEISSLNNKILLKENQQLKTINLQLVNQINNLSDKLQNELARKYIHTTANNEQELINAYKHADIYKKQAKILKSKVNADFEIRVEQLTGLLKVKDREIEQLKTQIKSLKKIQKNQQKGLIEMAGSDFVKNMKDSYATNEELKVLQTKCKIYERQLKKYSASNRSLDNQQEGDNVAKQMRQIEILRHQDKKNKKQLLKLIFESNNLREENDYLREQNDKLSAENQGLATKLRQLTKVFSDHSKDVIFRNSGGIAKLKTQIEENARLNSGKQYEGRTRLPVDGLVKFRNSIEWSDVLLSSKIIQVRVGISHQHINGIQARYQKGQSQNILSCEHTTFSCQSDEFVHYISGAFTNNILTMVTLVTNRNRIVKFGVQQPESIQFDFNVKAQEYPCYLFGQTAYINNQYCITKLGCTVDQL